MSPEQARGQALDKRTDIWSFGLVLFEMLTGKGMYAGKSLTETLGAVIHEDPSLEELPRETPPTIGQLIERCLRKDSRMRLRDMGDARIAIDECLSGTIQEDPLPAPVPGSLGGSTALGGPGLADPRVVGPNPRNASVALGDTRGRRSNTRPPVPNR